MPNLLKNKVYRLLRKTEGFFKTDMVYLARSGFWIILSKILSATVVFASSIAFANLLPENTYGVYRFVLSIFTLLSIASLGGIDNALIRAIAKGERVAPRQVIKARIKWGLWGGLGSFLLGGYYFLNGDDMLAMIFFTGTIFMPIMDPLHIYAAILNGLKKFDTLAKDEVLTRTTTAVLLIIAVFFTQDILVIILIYLISTTTSRYLFLRQTLGYEKFPKENEETKQAIGYGKHLSFIGILGQVSTQLDKILLFHFLGGAALAAYYLALVPLKQVQTILGSITTVAFPKFAENTLCNLKETLPKKLLKIYVLIIPIIIIYILLAPLIFKLIYPQYTEAILPSQILITQLIFFPVSFLAVVMTSQAQKKELYINSSVYSVIRIGLLLALVPFFGIYGAVVAILATTFIANILLLVLFFKS